MNVGKLKRVAIKEFKRSPAKTCFLLAMLPVALYFCVPLFLGKATKSSSGSTGSKAAAAKADFILPTTKPNSTRHNDGPTSWMSAAGFLDNDSLALPATVAGEARNPFVRMVMPEQLAVAEELTIDEERAAEEEQETEEEAGLTQEELELQEKRQLLAQARNQLKDFGLQLNATMIGRRARLATINGKSYEQGEVIPVVIVEDVATSTDTIQPQATEFLEQLTEKEVMLLHVDRRFVVVEMDGQRHRLRLKNEIPKDAIVVRPTAN